LIELLTTYFAYQLVRRSNLTL